MEHGAHANLRQPQRCARRAGERLCDGLGVSPRGVRFDFRQVSFAPSTYLCTAEVGLGIILLPGSASRKILPMLKRKAVWLDEERPNSCGDLLCHRVSEEWSVVGGWRLAQPRLRQNGCASTISHVPHHHVHHHHKHNRHRCQIQRPRVPGTTLLPTFSCLQPR
jgi:hypothetical protein